MHRNRLRCAFTCAAAVTASLLTSGVAARAATGPAARGSVITDQSVATNLDGTRAYLAPPAGFNPLTASDEQLAAYGFPPRPPDGSPAALRALWQQTVAAPAQRIVPTLVNTPMYNGPAIVGQAPVGAGVANATAIVSSNWSGYSVVDSAKPFTKEEIETQYTVPVAQQAFGTCTGGADYGTAWDGIDGNGSADVLQAGVEFDALCSGGVKSTFYSAWYEWFPYAQTRIGGFKIAPGDVMRITVWNTSPTAGHTLIVNFTANVEVALAFSAPPGTTLQGNSVQWVVERPAVGDALTTLTNYVAAPFTNSVAFNTTGSPKSYYPGSNPSGIEENITMADKSGKAISVAELQGLWDLWFYDEGSAY